MQERWFGLQDPTHLYFFNRFNLTHLAKKAGFRVDAVRSFGFTGSAMADSVLESVGSGGTLAVRLVRSLKDEDSIA